MILSTRFKMNAETLMIIVAIGLMITEIILILSVRKLTRQLKDMNVKLESTLGIVENKLHAIVEKVNFDIPKIMESGLQYIKFFKGS